MIPVRIPLAQWPVRVATLRYAKQGLWCSREPDFSRRRVAVVGSRSASAAACNYAKVLGVALATRGIDVVSGGALGVDNAAHEGAMVAGGCTWMVLGTSFDDVNTKGNHARLFDDVVESGGVVVSQFDSTSDRGNFPARNRTMVALVDAVVVVQATEARSGTSSTATVARALRVPCLVLPGPVWDGDFAGSRSIVERGLGRWIRDENELHAALGLALEMPRPTELDGKIPRIAQAQVLFEVLGPQPQHLDALSERTHMKIAELSAALLTLSLKNVVKEGPAGFWALGPTYPSALAHP